MSMVVSNFGAVWLFGWNVSCNILPYNSKNEMWFLVSGWLETPAIAKHILLNKWPLLLYKKTEIADIRHSAN